MGAVLALPTVAALVVPIVIGVFDPWTIGISPWGVPVLAVGAVVIGWTVTDFFTLGQGTLAPWDPPRSLVVTGLFSLCRNPMYWGVVTVVVGWAITLGSPLVAVFAGVLVVAFHIRVVRYEEPWAARAFPDQWPEYAAAVPRWIPRIR